MSASPAPWPSTQFRLHRFMAKERQTSCVGATLLVKAAFLKRKTQPLPELETWDQATKHTGTVYQVSFVSSTETMIRKTIGKNKQAWVVKGSQAPPLPRPHSPREVLSPCRRVDASLKGDLSSAMKPSAQDPLFYWTQMSIPSCSPESGIQQGVNKAWLSKACSLQTLLIPGTQDSGVGIGLPFQASPPRPEPSADPERWACLSPRPGAPHPGKAGVRGVTQECLPSGEVDVHSAGFISHLDISSEEVVAGSAQRESVSGSCGAWVGAPPPPWHIPLW